MNTLSWMLAGLIFAVGTIIGMVFVLAVLKRMGTLLIDMKSPEEEGIARFIFDKPMEEIAKHSLMLVKIEETRGLESIK